MRETIAGLKNFMSRFKFVLALVALMSGPAVFAVGTAVWYYGSVIADITARHRALLDSERITNRIILQDMQDDMERIVDKLGIATTKAENAASSAEEAAESAATAATAITDLNPTVTPSTPPTSTE